ncbi:hypothetical protein Dsin_028134 [Dipteronia sinensis]|uniref:RNase H type-1 domain-containing protein n=1 Tax=Dipteronia sinensis TaxID=43782 RepID=A0AAE0DTZ0_9ROSI|nr:hypothetical protein Dsin_028134 [Dipteronia sinensis]
MWRWWSVKPEMEECWRWWSGFGFDGSKGWICGVLGLGLGLILTVVFWVWVFGVDVSNGAGVEDDVGKGMDASGRVVAAVSKSVASTVTAELGELLALREGLLLAKSFNLIISVAEVDATNVASMLNSDIPSLCDAFFLITDIKGLCKVVGDCRCQAISRFGNSLAHHLAALAFSSFQRQFV